MSTTTGASVQLIRHATLLLYVGDSTFLVEYRTAAVDELEMMVRMTLGEEWTHGEANGICEQLSLINVQPLLKRVPGSTMPPLCRR